MRISHSRVVRDIHGIHNKCYLSQSYSIKWLITVYHTTRILGMVHTPCFTNVRVNSESKCWCRYRNDIHIFACFGIYRHHDIGYSYTQFNRQISNFMDGLFIAWKQPLVAFCLFIDINFSWRLSLKITYGLPPVFFHSLSVHILKHCNSRDQS